MRLPGEVDGCRAAARELGRAARAMGDAGDRIGQLSREEWRGLAALAWTGVRDQRVEAVRAQAESLAAVAAAVGRFAAELEDLQRRAARLTAEASDSGLLLDDCGWIPPVPVVPHELDPELLREALRRGEVRRRVVAAAAVVLAELRVAHDRLASELAGRPCVMPQKAPADDGWPGDWLMPTWWDAPSLTLSGSSVLAELRSGLPAVLRSGRAMGGIGLGVGVGTDLMQGRDVDDALTKGGAVLAATGMVALGAAAAPVAVPAVLVVAGSAVVSYGVGKIFDRFGDRLPWVQHPSEGRPRPGQQPQPQPRPQARPQPPSPSPRNAPTAPRRHVVHRTPAPAPVPSPR